MSTFDHMCILKVYTVRHSNSPYRREREEEEREPEGKRRLPDKADFFFLYRCCWQKSGVGAVCSATLVRDRVLIGCRRK